MSNTDETYSNLASAYRLLRLVLDRGGYIEDHANSSDLHRALRCLEVEVIELARARWEQHNAVVDPGRKSD